MTDTGHSYKGQRFIEAGKRATDSGSPRKHRRTPMPELESYTKTTYKLVLNECEYGWLRAYLQNGPERESVEDRNIRGLLFDALNPTLPEGRP
jgi:hypothetical protein